MKNSMKKIISLVLSGVSFCTLMSCSSDSGKTNSEEKTETILETDIDLVKDGKTDFAIVYPDSERDNANMQFAISELQALLFDATDLSVPAYTDKEKTSDTKILSVGKTAQAKKQTALMEKVSSSDLGNHGYVIQTIGTSVYMVGNSNTASLYSAYEFVERQFDYECYARDEYKIDKHVKNEKLLDFDLVDIPSFEARTPINWEGLSCKRLRAQVYIEPFNEVGGNLFCHNLNALIPGSKYYAEHPKWFAKYISDGHTGQELCLTAHGDEAEWLALKDAFVYEMEWRLLEDPETNFISFCQEDTAALCDCDACTKDYNLYDRKQYTATYANYIRMINAVAKDIKAWNKEVCPEREIVIFLWDYGKVKYAPVKLDANKKPVKDANGNYLPYSDEFVLEDNVGVYFCGLNMANYLAPDCNYNANDVEAIKRVQAIMRNPTMYFWTYSATFSDYLMPYYTIDTRQEYYKYMYDLGAIAVFDQAQYDQETAPDFGAMKAYVSAKLMWNLDENVEDLVDDFITNYYKDGASAIKNYYEEYRSYFNYLINERRCTGGTVSMATAFKTKEYWPYMRIMRFLELLDKAYEDIAPLKTTDPETYYTLYVRVKRETLTWRYLELLLYPETYSSDTVMAMQDELRADCIECGLTQRGENTSIGALFGF